MTDGGETFTLRNIDFNVRSFRSNVVLRWEWTPGSTLFVVWQQDRFRDVLQGALVGPGDLFGSSGEPGTNILTCQDVLLAPGRLTVGDQMGRESGLTSCASWIVQGLGWRRPVGLSHLVDAPPT